MVQLRTRRIGMREIIIRNWDISKFHGTVSFTIPNLAGTSPDPEGKNINPMASKSTWASHTTESSYPLVFSISFPFSSHRSLSCSHSNIITAREVEPSLAISPCDDPKLTVSTACAKYNINHVQHEPSTLYTEYSVHRVQHTASTAYTKYSKHRVQHTPSTA